MRKLALAITAALAMLAASFVSPIGVVAKTSTHSPDTPGPNSGARAPAVHAPLGRVPRRSVSTASTVLTCDAGFDTVASPNGVNNNELVATSAVNANDIWAVGDTSNVGVAYDQTLAEHWDGTSWTIIPTSNPGPYHNDLTAVDAISTNDVWVVGIYTTAADNSTVAAYAQHWNGSSWSGYVLSPSTVSFLFAIGGSSSTDVWAVGTDLVGSTFDPFIEHWNGSAWSSPGSGAFVSTFDNELFGVSAFSATDAWAVGEQTSFNGAPAQSFADHWDGSAWSLINTPNSASGDNEILWVNALEAGHAVGVGFGNHILNSTPRQSEAWDLVTPGVSSLNTAIGTGLGTGDNALIGVDRSGGAVQAVGYSRLTPTASRTTLAIPATWDPVGHTLTWGVVGASASPGAFNSVFDAVTAVSPYSFWATGYQNPNGTVFNQTLTESYCARHFNVTGPASSPTGSSFSITVTEQDGAGTTFTGYRGTVHFTSSDNTATLPANYTFLAGDNGTHTFTGVVLHTTGNQSITASDIAMPFTTPGSASIQVLCVGACQSSGGTAGGRTTNGGAPSTILGTRTGANGSPTGTAAPRLPRLNPVASSRDTASTAALSARSAPSTNVGAATPDVAATVSATDASISLGRARPNEAVVLVARTERASKPPDQSLWYLLPLVPLLICLLALGEVRRRRFKETSNARI